MYSPVFCAKSKEMHNFIYSASILVNSLAQRLSCLYYINMHVAAAALRVISTIKELYIGDNNLQPSDGIQLGNLIRNNTYLHTVDVRNNHLQVFVILWQLSPLYR